jgi:hypothetical protein
MKITKTHISLSGKRVPCGAEQRTCPRGGHQPVVVGSTEEQQFQKAVERHESKAVEPVKRTGMTTPEAQQMVIQTFKDISGDGYEAALENELGSGNAKQYLDGPAAYAELEARLLAHTTGNLNPAERETVIDQMETAWNYGYENGLWDS